MADAPKSPIDAREALHRLHKGLKERIEEFGKHALELRKREDELLMKKAPPGFGEATMHKLKREHGVESAFKIAWAAYDKKTGKKPEAKKAEPDAGRKDGSSVDVAAGGKDLSLAELCKACGKMHKAGDCSMEKGDGFGGGSEFTMSAKKAELETSKIKDNRTVAPDAVAGSKLPDDAKPKVHTKKDTGSGGQIKKNPLGKAAMLMGAPKAPAAAKPMGAGMPKMAGPKPAAAASTKPMQPKMPGAGLAAQPSAMKNEQLGYGNGPAPMQKDLTWDPASKSPGPAATPKFAEPPGVASLNPGVAKPGKLHALRARAASKMSAPPPIPAGALAQPPAAPAPAPTDPTKPAAWAATAQAGKVAQLVQRAKLGKSRAEKNDLRKSLGDCALCGKPEHPGSCR